MRPPVRPTPLPVFGIHADYAISPNWEVGAHAQFCGLDYGDYSGDLLDLRLKTEYWFSDSIGAGLDLTWYDIDISKKLGGGYRLDAAHRYSGPEVFLTFRF